MRIRSGHIVLLVGVIIVGMVGFILLNSGSEQDALVAAPDVTATVPPAGTDRDLVPIMEVETLEKDLGTVPNSANSRHPFKIKNNGKASLHIREVKASCACTVGHLPEGGLTIPPMGEGIMDIEIVPTRIQGFEARRTLTLFTNDPHRLTLEIGVTSHVDPEFTLEPIELNFGDVTKGSTPSLTMVLKQIQDAPVEVKELNTFGHTKRDSKEGIALAAQADDFNFTVVKRPENTWATPGKVEYDLTVALSPTIAAGSLEGKRVYVVTNVPRLPVVPIVLHGNIIAPYTLDPAPPTKLNLRADPATNTFAPAYATVSAEAPITIEDIQPQSTSLTMDVEPSATSNQARLKISITDAAPAGPLEEDILFNVNIGGTKYPERVGVRSFIVKK